MSSEKLDTRYDSDSSTSDVEVKQHKVPVKKHSYQNKTESRKARLLQRKLEKKNRKHESDASDKNYEQTLESANPVPLVNKKLSTAEQLELYLNALNDKDLSKLDKEKILKMRKEINPYGRTIAGSDKWLNFSITQLSHEYWKKFLITSTVGFLHRMCDEWKVPNGIPVVGVYEYLDDKSKLDTPEAVIKKDNKSMLYDYEFNRKWMEKRIIVKEFLEEMFQFNPDEHVRSAYRPNYKDSIRTPLDTMAARIAVKHLENKDKEFRESKSVHDAVQGIKKKKVKKTVIGKDGKKKVIIKEVEVEEKPLPPQAPVNRNKLGEEKPKDPNVKDTVTNFIPPEDIFHRFKMYYTENYEELRDAVLQLYCLKPDLELAINPYSWHDTKEEAEQFKKQHADEVITEVFTVQSGKWNFFDSFKEQRESVNFYNKNTIILEEIAKQIERDERLGQDLMNKRVEKEKKKNIIEAGPDAENFKKWREENSELKKMGAKHIGDTVDDDCPDDAVQVDVWRLAKGGTEVIKDKFFSQAEAPTFVKEAQDKAKLAGAM
jgi:hypothetical protein